MLCLFLRSGGKKNSRVPVGFTWWKGGKTPTYLMDSLGGKAMLGFCEEEWKETPTYLIGSLFSFWILMILTFVCFSFGT